MTHPARFQGRQQEGLLPMTFRRQLCQGVDLCMSDVRTGKLPAGGRRLVPPAAPGRDGFSRAIDDHGTDRGCLRPERLPRQV